MRLPQRPLAEPPVRCRHEEAAKRAEREKNKMVDNVQVGTGCVHVRWMREGV